MRKISDLTEEEIKHIAGITNDDVETWQAVEYRVFGKSRSIYSGYVVAKVYQYLVSIDIDIFA